MITLVDRDHDGRVSRVEWGKAMAGTGEADRAIPVRISFDRSPEEAFRDMDSNADGQLTTEEFASPMLSAFDCLDANHDGVVQPAEDAARRAGCTISRIPQTPAPTLPATPTP